MIIREKREIKKNLAAIKYVKNIKKILFDTFDNYAQGIIKKKYSKLREICFQLTWCLHLNWKRPQPITNQDQLPQTQEKSKFWVLTYKECLFHMNHANSVISFKGKITAVFCKKQQKASKKWLHHRHSQFWPIFDLFSTKKQTAKDSNKEKPGKNGKPSKTDKLDTKELIWWNGNGLKKG